MPPPHPHIPEGWSAFVSLGEPVPVWAWGWEQRVVMGCLCSKGTLMGSSQDMSLPGWGLSGAEPGLAQ